MNTLPRSKLGLIVATVFALVSVILAIYSNTCGNDVCGYVGLIPGIPWILFGFFDLSPTLGTIVWYSGIAINVILAYFIVAGIQKLFSRKN